VNNQTTGGMNIDNWQRSLASSNYENQNILISQGGNMCTELHLSGGTLGPNGDLKISGLSNSHDLFCVCQEIGFPRLGLQIQEEGGNTAVIQNSRKFHKFEKKQFVVSLGDIPPRKTLNELQRIIDASNTRLSITADSHRTQPENHRTHRRSKSKHSRR